MKMKEIQYFTEKKMNDSNYWSFMSNLPQSLRARAIEAFPSTIPNKTVVVLQGYRGPAQFLEKDASGDSEALSSSNGVQEIRVRYGARIIFPILTLGITNLIDNRFDWSSMFFSEQTGQYLASSRQAARQRLRQIDQRKRQIEQRKRDEKEDEQEDQAEKYQEETNQRFREQQREIEQRIERQQRENLTRRQQQRAERKQERRNIYQKQEQEEEQRYKQREKDKAKERREREKKEERDRKIEMERDRQRKYEIFQQKTKREQIERQQRQKQLIAKDREKQQMMKEKERKEKERGEKERRREGERQRVARQRQRQRARQRARDKERLQNIERERAQKARRENDLKSCLEVADQSFKNQKYAQAKENYIRASAVLASLKDSTNRLKIAKKVEECRLLLIQEEDQRIIAEAYLGSQKDIDLAIMFLQEYCNKISNSKIVQQALASLLHAKGVKQQKVEQKIKCFEKGKNLDKSNLLFKGELLGVQAARQIQLLNISEAFTKNEEAIKMLPYKKQFKEAKQAITVIKKALGLIRKDFSKQQLKLLINTIGQLQDVHEKNQQSKCIRLISETLRLRIDRQAIKQELEDKKAKKANKRELTPYFAALSKNIEKQIANLSGHLAKHVTPDTTNALLVQMEQIKKILVKLGHLQETEAQYRQNLIQLGEGLRNFERKEVEMLDKVNFEAMIRQQQIQS